MNDHFAAAVGAVVQGVADLEAELSSHPDTPYESARARAIALIDAFAEQARRRPGWEEDYELARCALVCWIDELFTLHCPWSQKNEFRAHCLELNYPELHAIRGRDPNSEAARRPVQGPVLFYEMAELAKKRPRPDAIETFFLCVGLGFQGERWREDERRDWLESTHQHIVLRVAVPSSASRAGASPGLLPLSGGRVRLAVTALVSATALATFIAFVLAVHLRDY